MPNSVARVSSLGLAPPPVIGIICCQRVEGDHILNTASQKYVIAAVEGAGGLPFLVPAAGDRISAEVAVSRLDGLLVPGSRSNVEPRHYDGPPSLPETIHDPARDGMSLPLLRAAVEADLPVLAICRGIQELNVALGGSLHQRLHELPGRLDHRAKRGLPIDERYAYDAHPVQLVEGGLFARLAGATSMIVNSLHQQGIDRLAPGLEVEATAPDGQIEAVRHRDAQFVVGVQWHPEVRLSEEPFSRALFTLFGEACLGHSRRRQAA
jgi:putative glutamine amidotransferase